MGPNDPTSNVCYRKITEDKNPLANNPYSSQNGQVGSLKWETQLNGLAPKMRNFVGPSDTPDASPSHVAASSDGRPGGPRIKQNTNELQLRIAKVTITNHY